MNSSELFIAEFVARLCPGVEHFSDWGDFRAIGFTIDGLLVAGAVFSQLNGFDALMSFGATTPRWATRNRFEQVLRFGFEDLDLKRITATTSRKNARARKVLKGAGFREEGMKRRGFDGVIDLMIYGMTKRDFQIWALRKQGRLAQAA